MSSQPPGWYDDPWRADGLRYWTGASWSHDVAVPAPTPHPTLPIQVAWGAIASLAVPLIGSRYVLRALADLRWPIAVYVVVLAVIAYGPPVVFCRWASRRWGSGRLATDIGLNVRLADLGWGPLTWLGCLGAQIVAGIIVVVTRLPFEGNTEQISAARDEPGYVIPILIVTVAVAPVVEEVIFRGMVLRGLLSRMTVVWAIGLQGVIFGLAHFDSARGMRNAGLVLVLAAVGVVLGVAAYRFRRLAPSMIAHAILNGVAMAVVLSGWTPAV